jgi:hypothetical protein
MTLKAAIDLDCNRKLEEAAEAYENFLLEFPDCREALLNLVVLYWQCTDFGFSAAENVRPAFIDVAAKRLKEIFETDEFQEISFWKKYAEWSDLGVPLSVDDCRASITEEFLDPAAFVCLATNGCEAKEAAKRLLDLASHSPTVRFSYLGSVIEGVFKRLRAEKW